MSKSKFGEAYMDYNYSDIKGIDSEGITFSDGTRLTFKECIKQRNGMDNFIGVRKADANPPFFEFAACDKAIRIQFRRVGLFSKARNRKDFARLWREISERGYSTYDLS